MIESLLTNSSQPLPWNETLPMYEAMKAFAYLIDLSVIMDTYGYSVDANTSPFFGFLATLFMTDGVFSDAEYDFISLMGALNFKADNRSWVEGYAKIRSSPFEETASFFQLLARFEKAYGAQYQAAMRRFQIPGFCSLALSAFQTLGLVATGIGGDPGGRKSKLLKEHLEKTSALLKDLGIGAERNQSPDAPWSEKLDALFKSGIPQLYAEEARAEKPKQLSLEDLVKTLHEMIGLDGVKREVMSLINLAVVRDMRLKQGLPEIPITLHLVFTGNPGTGKTTVARLLAGIYKELGLVSKGHLVETDRSGLVAGYIGQTAIKTQEIIQQALGGILFIDEAYSLSNESAQDFGHEAIDTLIKAMEDNRQNLVVIAAGYSGEMAKFLGDNPGMKSRFGRTIEFADYSKEELCKIFVSLCASNGYVLTEAASSALRTQIQQLSLRRGPHFGNGREVRNLFDRVVARQAARIAGTPSPTREQLLTFEEADF